MPIDAFRVENESVFAGNGTTMELVSDLELINQVQSKLQAAAARLRRIALGVFVVSVVPAIALSNPIPAVIGLVVAIAIYVKSTYSKVLVINNNRLDLFRRVLKTIDRDTRPGTRFEVTLRLRPAKVKVSEGPHPRIPGGKQLLYEDSWLTFSGRLADGSLLHYTLVDIDRKRTSKAGKYKQRAACLIRTRLLYPSAVYGDASFTSRLQDQFRLLANARVKAVVADPKQVAVKVLVIDDTSASKVHAATEAALLGAYRMLNLARRKVQP